MTDLKEAKSIVIEKDNGIDSQKKCCKNCLCYTRLKYGLFYDTVKHKCEKHKVRLKNINLVYCDDFI